MSASRLHRNIYSNQARFVLNGLVAFVLTPILFHALHPENYAILVFALAAVAVLEGLDLGLFSVLVRYVSHLRARAEDEELKRLTSSVFFLLLGTGTLGAMILLGLSPWLARVFKVSGTPAAPGHLVLALLGMSLVSQLPGTALRGYLDGCQDFFMANIVDITVLLLRAALTVFLLWSDFGLLAIAALFPAAALLRLLGMLWAAGRASIPFRPRLSEANWRSLRQTSGFASLTFVAENAAWCFFQLDTFLAARLLPLPNLALLAVSRRFPAALTDLSYHTLSATYPMLSSAAARGDRLLTQKFLFLSARNLLAFALPLAAALFVWTEVILRLWIGVEVLPGVPIFRVFLVFAVFASLRWVFLTFLYGVGKIRFSTALAVAMLIVGAIAGAWACSRSGLWGLSVAYTSVQMGGTLLLWHQALKLAEIPVLPWFRKAVAPALWAALPTVAWFSFSYWLVPHNIVGLVASVVPGVLLFYALFARLVVGPEKISWQLRARKLLSEID